MRIWLYPSPFVLHAKHFTVDEDLAVIGSSNMDYRSFALNYEVVMMMTSSAVVRRMRVVQDEYRSLVHASSPSRSGAPAVAGRRTSTTSCV